MAEEWPLTVELDVPEPRIERDRLVLSMDGTSFDLAVGENVYIDPVTRTAMLLPLPLSAAWRTTFTGDYARLTKADYTLLTAAQWYENPRRAAGDVYLQSRGPQPEVVTTTATYPANQPVFLSAHVPGFEDLTDQDVLVCGWGTEAEAGSVWVRFRASGAAAVYKGADLVGVYDWQGERYDSANSKGRPQSRAGKTVDFLLLPCRRRELLVVTSDGGFTHAFADLDAASETNEITPGASFFWRVPTGQACVQCAPCRFAQTGKVYSPVITTRYPPALGQTFGYLYARDRVGPLAPTTGESSALVTAALGSYTPDGAEDQLRIETTLTGDGDASPGLYAVDAISARTTTTTADQPFDITCRLKELVITVPETGGATATMRLSDPDALEAAGLEQPEDIGDRPFRIAVGGAIPADPEEEPGPVVDVLRGVVERPTITEGRRSGNTKLDYNLLDREQEFVDYTFADTLPYDGLALTATIEDLVKTAGFEAADCLISVDAFELPSSPGMSQAQWELLPQRGDTVAQWLERLHADFAATWVRGWVPTLSGYKYRFQDPADLGAGPHAVLYRDVADGVAAGLTRTMAMKRRVLSLTREKVRAEANQVIVVGQDPRTLRYLTAQYDDAAAQDPTTAPASRPVNWAGKVRRTQHLDPAITTQAAADRAKDILAARLASARTYGIFQASDFLIRHSDDRPIWKGDVIRVFECGGFNSATDPYRDYRVVAIPEIRFTSERTATLASTSPKQTVRRATYRGLQIAEANY